MSKVLNNLFVALLATTALTAGAGAGAPGPMATAMQKANGSGVVVRYRVDGAAKPGQPGTITLEFAGVTDPSGATVRLISDPELTIEAGAPQSMTLPQGVTTSVSLRVVPSADGRYYVNIFTAQRGAKSATSVAVQVGENPARAKAQAADDPDAVIVMPVE